MSSFQQPDTARLVELVEITAEEDAAAGRAPDAQRAVRAAVERVAGQVDRTWAEAHPGDPQGRPGGHEREIMAERYGLFYGAKRAEPNEAADVVVRRWREIEEDN